MLKILLLIFGLYVVYRFLLKHIMHRLLSGYLKKEKKKFHSDNLHLRKTESDKDISVDVGYRRKKSVGRISKFSLLTR